MIKYIFKFIGIIIILTVLDTLYYSLNHFNEIKIGIPYFFYWSYYDKQGEFRYGFELYNFIKNVIIYLFFMFFLYFTLKIKRCNVK